MAHFLSVTCIWSGNYSRGNTSPNAFLFGRLQTTLCTSMDSSPLANIAAIAANVGSTCSQYLQFVVSTNKMTFFSLFANVDANSLVLFVVALKFIEDEDAPNRLLLLWLSLFNVPRPLLSSYRSFPVVFSFPFSMLLFVVLILFPRNAIVRRRVVVFLTRRVVQRKADPSSSPRELRLPMLRFLFPALCAARDALELVDSR